MGHKMYFTFHVKRIFWRKKGTSERVRELLEYFYWKCEFIKSHWPIFLKTRSQKPERVASSSQSDSIL